MANLKIKDGDGSEKFVKALGTGTNIDPHVTESRTEISALPPLPAGTNNIGRVTVETLPDVTLAENTEISISGSLPTGSNTIGKVQIDESVAIDTLPPLPAGTNNIGKVEVNSLPNISSSRSRWREDFSGSALNVLEWNSQLGAGQSIAVTASELQINLGTSINSESVFSTIRSFKIPCRIFIIFRISQRIINQEIYFEITDASGDNKAGFLLDTTSTTTAKSFATCSGSGIGNSALTVNVTSSYGIVEVDIRGTEANFSSRATESNAARTNVLTRNRQIPDPNLDYKFQIRTKNLATAPTSNTTLFLDAIVIEDVEEINAEISTSRPATHLGNALGVQVLNTTAVPISGSIGNSSFTSTDGGATTTETLIALGGNATYTGAARNTILTRNTIRIVASADQSGTIFIDQSIDGTNWLQTFTSAVAAGVPFLAEQKTYLQYYRVRYTNGAVAQGTFRLYSTMFNIGA